MAQASPSVARPPAYGAGPLRSSTAPANPTLATIPPQVAPPPPGSFAVTDPPNSESEDDAAIMPAPSVDYLAHVQHPAVKSGRSPARGARYRRTMIPVLLTLGGLMLVAAVLKYVVNPDAPLAMLPGWTAALLAVAGLALLVVAGLNMVLLRQIQPS